MNINIKEIEKETQEIVSLLFSVSSLWQKDRLWAIKRLSEGVKRNRAAVYGTVKLSDKGPEDIKRVYANVLSSSKDSMKWWCGSGVFIDGSFFAVSQALATKKLTEATLEVVLYGYEVKKEDFEVEAGKIYNLGESLLKKVSESDRTAGIKGKVLLPGEKDYAGVKVEAWFRFMPSCCSGGPAAQAHTSEDGSFYLKGLQPGKYFIKLSHPKFLFKDIPGYELTKNALLDIGEIKAIPQAVVHLEWVKAEGAGKDFKESLRGKEVLKFEDEQCEFNFGRSLGIYDGCVLFCLKESGIAVLTDRFDFDPSGNVKEIEDYIIDLGKVSLAKAIEIAFLKHFSPKDGSSYFESIKEEHSYLFLTEDGEYFCIIRIVKIEMG